MDLTDDGSEHDVAGYSGTPLPRKLGIQAGDDVAFPSAPDGFAADLRAALPPDVRVKAIARGPLDVIVFFTRRAAELQRRFPRYRDALRPDGGLWIAWPKGSSGVATALGQGDVMRIGHAHRLVDNKVCAIDETWSGLRFVWRTEDRPA